MNLRLSVGIGRTSQSFPPSEPYVRFSPHTAQAAWVLQALFFVLFLSFFCPFFPKKGQKRERMSKGVNHTNHPSSSGPPFGASVSKNLRISLSLSLKESICFLSCPLPSPYCTLLSRCNHLLFVIKECGIVRAYHVPRNKHTHVFLRINLYYDGILLNLR